MTPRLAHELEVARDLAHRAGQAIMAHYQQDVIVEYKEKREPVTIADREADHLIRTGLQVAFPGDGLLSEEAEDDPARLDKERVWIVDPLDGTTEFIDKTGEFVVQIALTVAGRPVLGVVYQPVHNLVYYGVQGQGASAEQDGRRTELHVSQQRDPSQMCLIASRSHYTGFVDAARHKLGIDSVQRLGSVGLKMGQLSQGACDLYLATRVCKEWDLCAPHAILLEAGGVLTDLWGKVPVYNQPGPAECRGLLASNGQVHDQILEACAPLLHMLER
ncbi:MAG: 3'(2'),5'-bisphosphate nucleotidase CysQ [Anaerolineae bacterium]|nr:3'(2'),5'-bisphosphate nucleotidase CysQ [Anaerolineae bacterium]MDX9830147.1 3'(2'),5'-bisphosphate nucleotidase CysQ [Anaerolineae bacterium]